MGQEFIKFISVDVPTYDVRSLLNIPQDRFKAMVPLAIDTRFKNRTTFFALSVVVGKSPTSVVFGINVATLDRVVV